MDGSYSFPSVFVCPSESDFLCRPNIPVIGLGFFSGAETGQCWLQTAEGEMGDWNTLSVDRYTVAKITLVG